MTVTKRIQDILPALIVFFVVGLFGTYATVAFVVRDPWWMQTLVELRQTQADHAAPSTPGSAARPARR